jgi:uncharacterized protein
MSKERVPAVQGWFTMDAADPRLLGNRCTSCKSYFFPKAAHFCPNPNCSSTEFEEVPLSRRGKIWSFTDNRYQPPAPYVSPDPFVPYTIAAVELEAEKMVVLGQVVSGFEVDQLKAGMEVELVLDKLFEDDTKEYVVWKWKPVS